MKNEILYVLLPDFAEHEIAYLAEAINCDVYMDMEQRAVFMGGKAGQKPKEGLKQKPVSRKVQAMMLKHLFLTEGLDCNARYREMFAKEEEALNVQKGVYGISVLSRLLLSHFPVASDRKSVV